MSTSGGTPHSSGAPAADLALPDLSQPGEPAAKVLHVRRRFGCGWSTPAGRSGPAVRQASRAAGRVPSHPGHRAPWARRAEGRTGRTFPCGDIMTIEPTTHLEPAQHQPVTNTATRSTVDWQLVLADPATLVLRANVRTDMRLEKAFVGHIKDHGVLVPIIARRNPDGDLVVHTGHRRTLAAVHAGLDVVPVVVLAGVGGAPPPARSPPSPAHRARPPPQPAPPSLSMKSPASSATRRRSRWSPRRIADRGRTAAAGCSRPRPSGGSPRRSRGCRSASPSRSVASGLAPRVRAHRSAWRIARG